MLALTVVALAAASVAQAQTLGPVDQLFAAETAAGRFSGAVLVGRNGKVLHSKGYGLAEREWGQPNTPETRFRIGSLTKQVTAAMVLKLEERGQLKVTDSVCAYVDPCPEHWRPVTLHHLLTHTGGVPNLQADRVAYFRFARLPTTPLQTAKAFSEKPLDFAPGSKTEYSNTGYVLLSAVIEKVTGKPYRTALKDELLSPLGMNDTGYETAFDLVPRRAQGYVVRNKVVGRADYIDMTVPSGAGSLYATTADLYRWSEALHAGRVVSRASFARMAAAAPGAWGEMEDDGVKHSYGYGLASIPSRRGRHTFHTGSIDGFKSYLRRYGDDGLTVVILANQAGVQTSELAEQAAALAGGTTVAELMAR